MKASVDGGVMRSMAVLVIVALLLALAASAAEAKGRGSGKDGAKKTPLVTYVFKGTIASVSEGTVIVDVDKGNKFARSYAGEQVEIAVNDATKIRKDDAPALVSDLTPGDEIVVKARELRNATSFTARMLVIQTPEIEEGSEPVESEPVA